MEEQYMSNMSADLRKFINRTNDTNSSSQLMSMPQVPPPPPTPPPIPNFFLNQQHDFPSFLNLSSTPPHHQTFNHYCHEFGSDSTANSTGTPTTAGLADLCRFDVEAGGRDGGGGSTGGVCMQGTGSGAGTVRWPRQETLTLLDIRSKLDLRFKEANHKGPLWDEVSRIMNEEHGYQRSGKKCREKFENLYKYYKKTKEGKLGKQNGKHYRFFRQLEALYGSEQQKPSSLANYPNISSSSPYIMAPSSVNNTDGDLHLKPRLCTHTDPTVPRLCLISDSYNSLDTTSLSSNNDVNNAAKESSRIPNTPTEMMEKTSDKKHHPVVRKRSWKAKVKEFIDKEMDKLVEKQELRLERMMTSIQEKEQERMLREEEWRKQDAIRMEQQHKIWANHRAWVEARDVALLRALKTFTKEAKDVADDDDDDVQQVMLSKQLLSLEARNGHHQAAATVAGSDIHQNQEGDHPVNDHHHDHGNNRRKLEDWQYCTTSRSSSSINGSNYNINNHHHIIIDQDDHTCSSFYCNNNQIGGSSSSSFISSIDQQGRQTTRVQLLSHDDYIGSASTSSHDHHHPNVINVHGPTAAVAAGGTDLQNNHQFMPETCFRFLMGDTVPNLWDKTTMD